MPPKRKTKATKAESKVSIPGDDLDHSLISAINTNNIPLFKHLLDQCERFYPSLEEFEGRSGGCIGLLLEVILAEHVSSDTRLEMVRIALDDYLLKPHVESLNTRAKKRSTERRQYILDVCLVQAATDSSQFNIVSLLLERGADPTVSQPININENSMVEPGSPDKCLLIGQVRLVNGAEITVGAESVTRAVPKTIKNFKLFVTALSSKAEKEMKQTGKKLSETLSWQQIFSAVNYVQRLLSDCPNELERHADLKNLEQILVPYMAKVGAPGEDLSSLGIVVPYRVEGEDKKNSAEIYLRLGTLRSAFDVKESNTMFTVMARCMLQIDKMSKSIPPIMLTETPKIRELLTIDKRSPWAPKAMIIMDWFKWKYACTYNFAEGNHFAVITSILAVMEHPSVVGKGELHIARLANKIWQEISTQVTSTPVRAELKRAHKEGDCPECSGVSLDAILPFAKQFLDFLFQNKREPNRKEAQALFLGADEDYKKLQKKRALETSQKDQFNRLTLSPHILKKNCESSSILPKIALAKAVNNETKQGIKQLRNEPGFHFEDFLSNLSSDIEESERQLTEVAGQYKEEKVIPFLQGFMKYYETKRPEIKVAIEQQITPEDCKPLTELESQAQTVRDRHIGNCERVTQQEAEAEKRRMALNIKFDELRQEKETEKRQLLELQEFKRQEEGERQRQLAEKAEEEKVAAQAAEWQKLADERRKLEEKRAGEKVEIVYHQDVPRSVVAEEGNIQKRPPLPLTLDEHVVTKVAVKHELISLKDRVLPHCKRHHTDPKSLDEVRFELLSLCLLFGRAMEFAKEEKKDEFLQGAQAGHIRDVTFHARLQIFTELSPLNIEINRRELEEFIVMVEQVAEFTIKRLAGEKLDRFDSPLLNKFITHEIKEDKSKWEENLQTHEQDYAYLTKNQHDHHPLRQTAIDFNLAEGSACATKANKPQYYNFNERRQARRLRHEPFVGSSVAKKTDLHSPTASLVAAGSTDTKLPSPAP